MTTIRKILELFSAKERQQVRWLFVAILITAFLEVAGIATIMPFMAVVADPSAIHQNSYLNWAYNFFGFSADKEFLIFLGLIILVVLILSNSFTAFTTWLLLRFTYMREYSLSKRLLQKYLHKPYLFFLNDLTCIKV